LFCSLAGFAGLTDETFIRLRWAIHRRFLSRSSFFSDAAML
jgi:hypothetical protein